MFFLPLPMDKTLETLDEVTGDDQCPLHSPELQIMVNKKPSKEKVVWRTIVNVDAVKQALQKLKQLNRLHKKVDEQSVDDIGKHMIETLDTTTDTMQVKAAKKIYLSFSPTPSTL